MFYVYTHMRPDLTPFYIGKGKGSRAYDLSPRNRWHGNIVAKYGVENVIVELQKCSSESEAFFREVQTIKFLREAGVILTNLTDGGSGGLTSSLDNLSEKGKRRFSKEGAKEKHSEIMKQVSATPEFSEKVSIGTTVALRTYARENHLAGLKRANAAQTTEQRSEAQLRSFANDTERRERHSVAATKMQQNMTDEVREQISVKLTNANNRSWSDPDVRARRIAGMLGKKKTRKSSKGASQ